MTDREATIILNMLPGIGPARLGALLEYCGTPGHIFECSASDLSRIQGISAKLAESVLNWKESVNLEEELDLASRSGAVILTRDDEEYPEILRGIHDAPLCLYVRGKIPDQINSRSLAIVGTRNITNYGAAMAQHLAEAAGYAGWTVVSGLAIGVDTVAHRSVLSTPEGDTVAVLGGGLARLHPQENLGLARQIVNGRGAVISEFPMRFSPTRRSFPMRNRIISGLSLGTLVVEAGLNSGSLITASLALEQGRHLFAVPGQADHFESNGCNDLIRHGAVLVERFEHILEEFDFLPGFESDRHGLNFSEESAEYEAGSSSEESDDSGLSSVDQAILTALKSGEASLDELTVRTSLPASEIISALIALEILCRIKKQPNGRYLRLR